ncbi:hypothetical protein AB0D29_34280 [Streptomyces sp. NPDC048424]|uniref:hypothetical protein n=1 Tax=Streptomyces sp. NPDC048424 TaxID=3155265 RepID=UPI00344A34BB
MNDDDQRALDLLHQLDRLPGPTHMEFPEGFDYDRAKARAEALAERLGHDFGPCRIDTMQDAAAYFIVCVPQEGTEASWPIRIWLSNYGDLASISPPSGFPDRISDTVPQDAISPTDHLRLESALADLEYVLVPHRPLKRAYDGIHTDWTWVGDPTWWIRFFYHL